MLCAVLCEALNSGTMDILFIRLPFIKRNFQHFPPSGEHYKDKYSKEKEVLTKQ